MQNSSKSLIITLAAVLIAAFFMPWITFFVSVNAWDLVFGNAGQMLDTPLRFIVVVIPISGILIIYGTAFNNGNYPISKQFLFLLPIITLIIIALVLSIKLGENGGRMFGSEFENVIKIFGIGFWLTITSSIILPFVDQRPIQNNPAQHSTSQSNQTITQNEISSNSSQINHPKFENSKPLINLPKVNWDKIFKITTTFLSKYKIVLLIGLIAIITLSIIYIFFIKADPLKDGKKLAQTYCACSTELNNANLKTIQSFLNEFDNKKYKSRIEARNTINNFLQINDTKYSSCIQDAELKYKERYADYNAKGGRNVYILEQTYNSLIGACGSNYNNEVLIAQNNVDQKIRSIKDPEPDIEKIKSDLIGKSILGWNFDALSEFDKVNISNIVHGPERIEYTIDLHLIGYTSKDPHDAQIFVSYNQTNDEWNFYEVKCIFITYDYVISSDNWNKITPLQNCKWNVDDKQKISWKTWDWGNEIISGPDAIGVVLPNAESYLIKSREGHPITIRFTYRPTI